MTHSDGRDGVTISDLSAGYASQVVLHGITAQLPRRNMTAIVGPNGSGKSTLLNAIAGVARPYSGSVTVPAGKRPAFVVQRSAVSDGMPITVLETVSMGRWANRGLWRRLTAQDHEIVAESMRRLGILDLARRRLSTLSGGQRQRVLVAQGLAQQSDVLLLDEPATGLDLSAKDAIATALADTASQGTIVAQATHDLADAQLADHCLLLSGGRLLAEGAPSEVLTAEALNAAWGLRGRVRRNEFVSDST